MDSGHPDKKANTKNALRMPNSVPQYHHLLDNRPAITNAMTARTDKIRVAIDHSGDMNLKPNKRTYETKRRATPIKPMRAPLFNRFSVVLSH